MTVFTRGNLIATLLLLICSMSPTHAASIDGTIVLKSGERLENVTFKVDKLYMVLKLDWGKDKRNISFDKIESVLNPNGIDITVDVLGGVYEGTAHGTVSRNSESYREASKARWSATFYPSLEYSLPVGYYYEGFGGSIGYGGAVCFSVTHNLGVRFGASKIGMSVDDDFYLVPLDPYVSIVSQDLSMSSWRYYVAAQYYSFLDRSKEDLSMYYLYAGFAGVSHKSTADVVLQNNITGLTGPAVSEISETKGAIVWGFGVTTMVGTKVGLDFGLDWDMVAVGSHETRRFGLERTEVDFAHIFELHAGLVFYL